MYLCVYIYAIRNRLLRILYIFVAYLILHIFKRNYRYFSNIKRSFLNLTFFHANIVFLARMYTLRKIACFLGEYSLHAYFSGNVSPLFLGWF